jgi:hypothetical protein
MPGIEVPAECRQGGRLPAPHGMDHRPRLWGTGEGASCLLLMGQTIALVVGGQRRVLAALAGYHRAWRGGSESGGGDP